MCNLIRVNTICSGLVSGTRERKRLGYADLPKKSSTSFGLFSQYTKMRYTGSPVAMMRHPIPVIHHKQLL